MAMPASPAPITTIEELLALPEDSLRHELLDGLHVVTPAPEYPHQALLGALAFSIRRQLEGNPTSKCSRARPTSSWVPTRLCNLICS
jgi:hypothetical protein